MPGASDDIVALLPDPVDVVLPGKRISIHSPVSGIPSSTTLPVDTSQVGCVMVPITGAGGVTGCVLITTSPDGGEMHPAALVTVKVYVPGLMLPIVLVVPEPVTETLPGVRVTVHVPVAGSPLRATLPVEVPQVGWVMAPMMGAEGVSGWTLITTLDDDAEMQPFELVTVNVYVPGTSPVMVVLEPVPVTVAPPGVTVIVQSPDAGRLLSITLPVGSAQVGCVTVPGIGAVGLALTVRV